MDTPNGHLDIISYLASRKKLVEGYLDDYLVVQYPEKVFESMKYSTMAGGKRLRPILCLAACEACGGSIEMAMPTACALEMIHTSTLIHDDLPAMDNDDYRRHRLTNHKVFGDAIAILAGDSLTTYGFQLIATKSTQVPAERALKVSGSIATAITFGLIPGQTVDLQSEGTAVSVETLDFIHRNKTGVLLEVSTTSGAELSGASEDVVERLSRYGKHIGLAFQIVDDILDVTSTREKIGKDVGKDEKVKKATYPRIHGLDESYLRARKLVEDAKKELEGFGERGEALAKIADFILSPL